MFISDAEYRRLHFCVFLQHCRIYCGSSVLYQGLLRGDDALHSRDWKFGFMLNRHKKAALLSQDSFLCVIVRKMGLEPTRLNSHKILSLARLPVPTLPRVNKCYYISLERNVNRKFEKIEKFV